MLLPSPIAVVYNSEFSVPADDVTLEIPYVKGCEGGDFLLGYENSSLVFKGQIDEIVTLKSSNKITVKITARSMAGILLDNEAEPCIYFNASSSVIFERHLKRYFCSNLPNVINLFTYMCYTKGDSV